MEEVEDARFVRASTLLLPFPCFPIIQHFILILLFMFGQVFPCSDVKHTTVKAHHLPETQFCHLISFNLLFSNNLRLDDKKSVLIFYFRSLYPGVFCVKCYLSIANPPSLDKIFIQQICFMNLVKTFIFRTAFSFHASLLCQF